MAVEALSRRSPKLGRRRAAALLAGGAFFPSLSGRAGEAGRAEERARMIRTIREHARSVTDALGRDFIAPEVLEVMERLPRHEFVPNGQRAHAYEDRPLPIGHGQTISQPFIVALMTDLLSVRPDGVVLEVGTGSGYQAAVLARLVREVHTIEIIEGLAETARERLDRPAYRNVETHVGDGYYGVPSAAPFDGIVVTAAASQIPPPLIQQLRPGGRLVIPVGRGFMLQYLMLVDKDAEGAIRTRQTLPVRFVPLTRSS
jgi:protein-L-isoaspartate(D-aspartate) O-methyltransferase